MYEAHGLISGKRVLSSKGISQHNILTHRQLFVYCLFGILAGLVGGLLGLGGGFIMGPLFLELGIPPQVVCHLVCSKRWSFHGDLYTVFSQCMNIDENKYVKI
jgi:hypothetical protein